MTTLQHGVHRLPTEHLYTDLKEAPLATIIILKIAKCFKSDSALRVTLPESMTILKQIHNKHDAITYES